MQNIDFGSKSATTEYFSYFKRVKSGWTKIKTGNIHLHCSLFIRYQCLVWIHLL